MENPHEVVAYRKKNLLDAAGEYIAALQHVREAPDCQICAKMEEIPFSSAKRQFHETLAALGDEQLARMLVPEFPADLNIKRYELMERIARELDHAYAKHGKAPWSRHEFYAILLEEVDELWDDVKGDRQEQLFEKELVQVAAMCFRHYETKRIAQDAVKP